MKAKWLLCVVAVISGLIGGLASHFLDRTVYAQMMMTAPTEVRAQNFVIVDDKGQTLLTIRSATDRGRQALEIFDAQGPVATLGTPGPRILSMR